MTGLWTGSTSTSSWRNSAADGGSGSSYPHGVTNTLYEDPEIYDILHAPGTAKDLGGLLRIERVYGRLTRGEREAGLILEPACGSGRYVLEAARRGRRVAGFDLSAGMVRYARARLREKGLGGVGRVFEADMAGFAGTLRKGKGGRRAVTLAFNLINSIRHLETDAALGRHFEEMARVMHPGGVYVVGISLSDYGREFPTEDVWHGKRRGVRVHQVVQYEPPAVRASGNRSGAARVERVISQLTITTGRGKGARVQEASATYGLRCYDPEQWYGAINRSPLRVHATCDEQGAALPPACPGYSLFVLTRRDGLLGDGEGR